jgi:hypothetical protein
LIASAHLFRFRSLRDAGRSLFVDRRRLPAVEGLRFCRVVFVGATRTEGFTIGRVDPRLQLALCLWEDEFSLERFLQSPVGRRWREATSEYCSLRLDPFGAFGSYFGEAPLAELPRSAAPDGPVVLWTFASIPLHSRFFFWRTIRHANRALLESQGLIAATAGPERSYAGAMTFTVWESLDDALRFAYREQPHKAIVKRANAEGLLKDSMFIRFRPLAVEGRWPRHSRFAPAFDEFAWSDGWRERVLRTSSARLSEEDPLRESDGG